MKSLFSDARSNQGAVLPLAVVILLLLSVVLLGLASLTGQEPLSARNHTLLAQAQALADAGLDRALWALSNPGAPDGVVWSAPAPSPYDGSATMDLTVNGRSLGGFRLRIVGTGDRQRQVLATGFAPSVSGALGQARRSVSATAVRLRLPTLPAGVTVRGDLRVGPGVIIDAAGDASCGSPAGTWSTGTTTLGTGSQILGLSGSPIGTADVRQTQDPASFDAVVFDSAELSAFKALARAQGTYYRGSIAFDATRPLPGGLVFIDTASGQAISPATPDTDLAAVTVRDGAAPNPDGRLRGWIVVNGSLAMDGQVVLEGLAFAADRFTQSGRAQIRGAAVAGHIRSASPSLIEARPETGPALAWSCQAARTGGGGIPQRWLIKPGTYRETEV